MPAAETQNQFEYTQAFDDRVIEPHDPNLYRFDAVADGVDTFADVDEEQLERYREQGYVVVNKALSPAETQSSLDALVDLVNGVNPSFRGVQFEAWARDRLPKMSADEKQDAVRKMWSMIDHDPRVKAIAEHPQLLATLRKLMGGEPKLFQDMALFKPPGGGTEKPWHQDKAYFDVDVDAPVVGVWIALDEASPENGCMHVIPGSHRDGPVLHFKRRDWQICDTDVQTQRDVVVPLKPGGLFMFDGLLHHGTPSNNSRNRRRALQLHYTTSDAKWLDEAYRLGIFGPEGKNVTC